MSQPYDFLVLGGGSAGFNSARLARSWGKRVAIVDGAPELGGLCILRGCMPSKALLHSTDVLHRARQARALGLRIPEAEADMPALQARKRRLIKEFADYREGQLKNGHYDLYREYARFVDTHTVELSSGQRLTAERILIATGSRVSVPPVPGLAETPFWTSDDVLNLERRPESVLVLGGGVVACELAQFLRRVGSRVILIQRSPQLLSTHSFESAAVVEQAFVDEGIELYTDTRIERIGRHGKEVSVTFHHQGKTVTKRARHLFNALGREANTAQLALPAAGVECDLGGHVRVNRWQQTRARHIYAAGDVCGPHDIVHLAVAQGELAARHAFGQPCRRIDPALFLSVIFTDPGLASIGLSERELQARGVTYLSASYPFNDHGKSLVMDAHYGHVKVFAEPERGRILGAEIVGPEAGELIHCFSGPLALRATVFDLLRAPWYHPTLAEILTYPLEGLAEQISKRVPPAVSAK